MKRRKKYKIVRVWDSTYKTAKNLGRLRKQSLVRVFDEAINTLALYTQRK